MSTSTISITISGSDITTSVIFASLSYEAQLSATPGTFSFDVKDAAQTFGYGVTGLEVICSVDGVPLFGGYVTQVTRKFAFPVEDTTVPGQAVRIWNLQGVDYNILFDKLVLRDTTNYLTQLQTFVDSTFDDTLIAYMFANYLDMRAGFDTTTLVNRVRQPVPAADQTGAQTNFFRQQGAKLRDQMDEFALICGAIYYFNASKQLVYRAIENSEAKWGFSDVPNKRAVSASPAVFQGATYGFREINITEDGSALINDAFVWGGSFFAGTAGGTVFSRAQNAASVTKYGDWQAPFAHFGEPLYKTQASVDFSANLIVTGSPNNIDPATGRGLVYPQFRANLAWFGQDVPVVSGNKDHLRPGDLVTFHLFVMHDTDFPQGLILQLPARQIRVSIQTTSDGNPYIRFDGIFGLQYNDPFSIWRYILKRQPGIQTAVFAIANNASTSSTYGAVGNFVPIPAPDGTTTTFALSASGIGYINGTQQVYLNRLFQIPGTDYIASDPTTGQFTFVTAPAATDTLFVICNTL